MYTGENLRIYCIKVRCDGEGGGRGGGGVAVKRASHNQLLWSIVYFYFKLLNRAVIKRIMIFLSGIRDQNKEKYLHSVYIFNVFSFQRKTLLFWTVSFYYFPTNFVHTIPQTLFGLFQLWLQVVIILVPLCLH